MSVFLLPSLFPEEKEYRELYAAFLTECRAARPLPMAACGLSSGASDAFLVTFLSDLKEAGKCPALILLPEEKECVRLCTLLAGYGLRAAFYTGRDLTFYNITASHEYEYERIRVLWGLSGGHFDVILTTPDAALSFTVAKEPLDAATIRLSAAEESALPELVGKLTAAGYIRCELVDGPGQFAVRGGIADIYAPNLRAMTPDGTLLTDSAPIRVEFFGDEIDRMGTFDIKSQRMQTMITLAEIPPAREVLPSTEAREKLLGILKTQRARAETPEAREELDKETADLTAGGEIRFADKYLTLFCPERATLLSYFGEKAPVVIKGTNAVKDRLTASLWHLGEAVESLLTAGVLPGRYAEYSKDEKALSAFLSTHGVLHLDSIAEGLSGKRLSGLYTFRSKHTLSYEENYPLLFEDLKNYRAGDYRVILSAPNEATAKNAAGLLREEGYSVRFWESDGAGNDSSKEEKEKQDPPYTLSFFEKIGLAPGTVLLTCREKLPGFELPAARVAVLSLCPAETGGGLSLTKQSHRREKKDAKTSILSYADLHPGDLVVHEAHGIGRYLGLETLTIDGVTMDYVSIQYAGSDRLFLPCDRLESITKYIGAHADDGLVKLSRFGGGEWKKAKARAKSAAKDMAKDLIRLYAQRERRPGFAFPPDDDAQADFEAAFEHQETEGQAAAAEDIKADMMKPVPMDRLLCGDVGFGKTEVALRAAYKAIMGGKQVAILVPTTILALQHFQTIQSRMRAFGVQADMLSRFRTPKQQAQTLRRLARGDLDLVVGTHRLVSSDVKFKDLGLLIVDEEQRFGVAQKEKLKKLAGNVDVLTLSATPIPRTLNMAMSGIRDISILDEAPGDRLPVQTYVLEDDELIVNEAIRRELRRGGQVFYLHNEVAGIREVAARIARAVPEARITVAHGQMEKEELEEIWGQMLSGEIDVLVSTTIIETGVDVPNANTLIVDNAHRLGLSQLHQIRGRVGRSPRRAYAYFTYPKGRALGDIQRKRLEAIREYAEFGAGFRIALRDLELRGAGNILGAEQHGHLDAVGYDLYIKLLNEAVLEEKGEAPKSECECVVSLPFDACLPAKYVPDTGQRMALYRRISMIGSKEDLLDMTDELTDRYGELPAAAANLLQIALIRSLAARSGVTQVRQDGAEVAVTQPELCVEAWMTLSEKYPGKLRMMMSATPYIRCRMGKGQTELAALRDLLFDLYTLCAQKDSTPSAPLETPNKEGKTK